jgi:hypothetical protein
MYTVPDMAQCKQYKHVKPTKSTLQLPDGIWTCRLGCKKIKRVGKHASTAMRSSERQKVSTCLLVAVLHSTYQLLEEESRNILREAALTFDKIKQLPCSARQAHASVCSVSVSHPPTWQTARLRNTNRNAFCLWRVPMGPLM